MRVVFLLVLIAAVAYATSSPADESHEANVKQKLLKAKLSVKKTANHVIDVINNFLKRNTIKSEAVYKKLISARRASERVLANLKMHYKKGRYTASDNYKDSKINLNKFGSSLLKRLSKIVEGTVKLSDGGAKKVGITRPGTDDNVNAKEQIKRAMSVTRNTLKYAMEIFARKDENSGGDESPKVDLTRLGKTLTKSTKDKIKDAFRAMENLDTPRVFEEAGGKMNLITEKDAVKKLLSTINGVLKQEEE